MMLWTPPIPSIITPRKWFSPRALRRLRRFPPMRGMSFHRAGCCCCKCVAGSTLDVTFSGVVLYAVCQPSQHDGTDILPLTLSGFNGTYNIEHSGGCFYTSTFTFTTSTYNEYGVSSLTCPDPPLAVRTAATLQIDVQIDETDCTVSSILATLFFTGTPNSGTLFSESFGSGPLGSAIDNDQDGTLLTYGKDGTATVVYVAP